MSNCMSSLAGSGCIVGTRPLSRFLAFFVFFHIVSVVMQLPERLELWTGCTVGLPIWRLKMFFFSKLHKEGLSSIIRHNVYVFALFPPLLKRFLRHPTEISHKALLRWFTSNQWGWCLWNAQLGLIMHNLSNSINFFSLFL